MNKTSAPKQHKDLTYISLTIAFFGVIVGLFALSRAQAAISYADENFIRLSRTNAKLNFCIDNNISPCRYETILEWNNKHSANERFNIQPND